MGILDNKIIKFIIRFIEYVFIVLLFIYITFIILCKITENNYINGYKFTVVKNNSLNKKYDKYDAVIIKKKDYFKYKEGDIVVYKETKNKDNYQIIELIYNKEGSSDLYAVTRNLNNKIYNPEVNIKSICGVILDKVPIVTCISHLVNNKISLLCLFIIVIVFISIELIYCLNEKKKLDEEFNKETT